MAIISPLTVDNNNVTDITIGFPEYIYKITVGLILDNPLQ